jgi:acetolactate synthase-1/2/3 large subunit
MRSMTADIAVTSAARKAGAVMMPKAAGKLTGRPGIAFVTRGPGATNGSPGLHIAKTRLLADDHVRRPSGARNARARGVPELDYRAVFGTMVKWATEIDDPARIPEIVSRAFHVAMNGRPGPVVIALPEDMLMERVSVGDALAAD